MHLADTFIQSDLLYIYSGYTFFCQYVCSLWIEPTTFALLTQCSTTEPQEHCSKITSHDKTHWDYIWYLRVICWDYILYLRVIYESTQISHSRIAQPNYNSEFTCHFQPSCLSESVVYSASKRQDWGLWTSWVGKRGFTLHHLSQKIEQKRQLHDTLKKKVLQTVLHTMPEEPFWFHKKPFSQRFFK